MLTIANLPENIALSEYEYNLMNEFYKEIFLPQIYGIAKQIDNDVRKCIKEEIKNYGSIVKRYGNWANFINEEMGITHYQAGSESLYHATLFYRGKHIRDYDIK